MDNSNNVIIFAAGLLNSAAMGYACTLDRSDRVICTEYNTDANISPLSWKRLQTRTYDALGRAASTGDIVTTSYSYDVRSRLTGISSPLLNQQLLYGNPTGLSGATSDYSGNLVALIDSRGDNDVNTVCYKYDRMGLMIEAKSPRLTESFEFDRNSNVTAIYRRWYLEDAASTELTFNGNLVTNVREYTDDNLAGAVPKITCGDYIIAYDSDGRVVADSTRSIASIEYEPWGSLLPRTIDMGTNSVHLRHRPDGSLHSRKEIQRYMELYTNSKGETNSRVRTVTTNRQYRGSFEHDGSGWLYHTNCGYISLKDNIAHYYARDYQGSTRAVYKSNRQQISPLSLGDLVVTPNMHTVEQATDYYPSGLPVDVTASVTQSLTAAVTDRLHIGNRWMNHAGLSLYDNTARMYDPLTVRFHTPDPLDYKRPWDSPWSHCGGNPANFIDPDGRVYKLTGDSAAVEKAVNIYNQMIGDYGMVGIQNDGTMTITPTKPEHDNERTKTAFDTLNRIIESDNTTEIKFVNLDHDIRIGDGLTATVDIGDIERLGISEPMSQYSVLLHETYEQFLLQNHPDGINQCTLNNCHNRAIGVESRYTGYKIDGMGAEFKELYPSGLTILTLNYQSGSSWNSNLLHIITKSVLFVYGNTIQK